MNYTVIRTSDDHLEHHGILGMKWGVWNDETRARRMGSSKRRPPKKDYSKMSDKRLKREVNRRRTINDLRRMDEEEAKRNRPEITKKILAISKFIGAITGLATSINLLRKKSPEVASAVNAGSSFIKSLLQSKGDVRIDLDVYDKIFN